MAPSRDENDKDDARPAWTWYMVSISPRCQPTGMALHPDEVPTIYGRSVPYHRSWPHDAHRADEMFVIVDAASYEDAQQQAARLVAAAWREAARHEQD